MIFHCNMLSHFFNSIVIVARPGKSLKILEFFNKSAAKTLTMLKILESHGKFIELDYFIE